MFMRGAWKPKEIMGDIHMKIRQNEMDMRNPDAMDRVTKYIQKYDELLLKSNAKLEGKPAVRALLRNVRPVRLKQKLTKRLYYSTEPADTSALYSVDEFVDMLYDEAEISEREHSAENQSKKQQERRDGRAHNTYGRARAHNRNRQGKKYSLSTVERFTALA